jgi:hypothetical protein
VTLPRGSDPAANSARMEHLRADFFANGDVYQDQSDRVAGNVKVAALSLESNALILDLVVPHARPQVENCLNVLFRLPKRRKRPGEPPRVLSADTDHLKWKHYRTKYGREHPGFKKWIEAQRSYALDLKAFEREWQRANTTIKATSLRRDHFFANYSEDQLWIGFVRFARDLEGRRVTIGQLVDLQDATINAVFSRHDRMTWFLQQIR